jgi:ribosomal protein L9
MFSTIRSITNKTSLFSINSNILNKSSNFNLFLNSFQSFAVSKKKEVKLILTKDVDSLGVKGEVVVVKKGFARNFLLPSKNAVTYTDQKRLEIPPPSVSFITLFLFYLFFIFYFIFFFFLCLFIIFPLFIFYFILYFSFKQDLATTALKREKEQKIIQKKMEKLLVRVKRAVLPNGQLHSIVTPEVLSEKVWKQHRIEFFPSQLQVPAGINKIGDYQIQVKINQNLFPLRLKVEKL